MKYQSVRTIGKCEKFKQIFLRSVRSGMVTEDRGLHGKPVHWGTATSIFWGWTCHLLKAFCLCQYLFVWWLLPPC